MAQIHFMFRECLENINSNLLQERVRQLIS